MKLLFFAHISVFVCLALLCAWPSSATGPSSTSKTDDINFTRSLSNKDASAGNSISKTTPSNVAHEKMTTGSPSEVPVVHNPKNGTFPDKTADNANDSLNSSVEHDVNHITESDSIISDTTTTNRTIENNTMGDSDMSNASDTNSSINNIAITGTETGNNSIINETTVNNGSIDKTSQCPDMCHCPQYEQWSAYLVPYLRQQLGPQADRFTDNVMKYYLLAQFAISAESPKAVLGRLFEKVQSEVKDRSILSLWWTRFGITTCFIKANTTFYLDAATEARLFPQVGFKEAQIDLIAKTLNNQTIRSVVKNPAGQHEQRVASHQLYNITFICKQGAKVVMTHETSLFRYGRWSSTGCQVNTDGILTLDRNWSLIELSITNENVLWFQNVSISEIKNDTSPDTVDHTKDESNSQFQNSTMSNTSLGISGLKKETIFPSIQEFILINTSLSLQQLAQVLVWFQKAQALSLKNNSLENFNCSQLIPAPATWSTLVLSFNGLTSVPACVLRNSLTSLDLSSNSISNISVLQFPRYIPCPKLDSLNLSSNNIRDVGIFADLNKLTFLYLARNRISFLNKLSFTRLPGLAVIDLSHNLLHKLDPGSFKSLIYLQFLHLEHNYLQQFDRSVSPLRLDIPLECKIYLNYNRFSHPPFQSQLYNPATDFTVYATGNPFACDCAMSAYINATKNSSLTARYSDRSDMYCVYPPHLRGRPLDDVIFTDTCPVVSDCPADCNCTLNRNDNIVTVDCSGVEDVQFPQTLPKIHKLRLEFQRANQKIQTFTTFHDSEYLHRVVSINVSGRGLTHVPDFMCEALKQAEVLDLSYNCLHSLPACFQSRPKEWPVLEMRLAHNPWSCDCDAVNLTFWLAGMVDGTVKNGVRISDAGEVQCSADTDPGVRVAEWDSSHCSLINYLPWAVTLGVVLALAAIVGPLLYVYRLQAMVVIHDHFHIRPFTHVPHYNEDDFDHEALVVHGVSNAGISWVLNTLLPRTQDTHHRICIPDRDFLLGSSIAESYASSVPRAKATLCLLSLEATHDEWWLYAFQLARAENARHPHMKLLLVLMEKVDDGELPEEVREFMESNTYLSVEDDWFWKKLFYYLPDPPKIQLLD